MSLHYITVALVVSSFGKYLYLLTIVWPYTDLAVHAIDLFVLTSNIVALQAFLNCRFMIAASLVLAVRNKYHCCRNCLSTAELFDVADVAA